MKPKIEGWDKRKAFWAVLHGEGLLAGSGIWNRPHLFATRRMARAYGDRSCKPVRVYLVVEE